MKHYYRVRTWDADLQRWTPQIGLSPGRYSLMGLRRAIRKLRNMGYGVGRCDMLSVLIERF